MSDPVAVLSQLEDLTVELGLLSNAIYQDRERFATIEAEFDDAYAYALDQIVTVYASSDKRLPGEDVRKSMVMKELREEQSDLLANYRQTKAKIDRDERKARRLENQIDGFRSVLSYLKTESEAIR